MIEFAFGIHGRLSQRIGCQQIERRSPAPVVIADWPEDIAHSAMLMVTGPGLRMASPRFVFELLDLPLFDSLTSSEIPQSVDATVACLLFSAQKIWLTCHRDIVMSVMARSPSTALSIEFRENRDKTVRSATVVAYVARSRGPH